MLNISQIILVRTDSNLCRKELTVHWSAPNSLIRSYLQSSTNSMWGDESEAVAPIIWLYQAVDARKEEVFFPNLLITLRRHVTKIRVRCVVTSQPGCCRPSVRSVGRSSPVSALTFVVFHGSLLVRTFVTLTSRTSSIMDVLPD